MPTTTPLPDPPSLTRPLTFSTDAEAWCAAQKLYQTELNALTAGESAAALAVNLAGTAAGSGADIAGFSTAMTGTTAKVSGAILAGAVNLEWYASLVTGNDYTTALAAAVATGKNVYVPWRLATRDVSTGVSFANDHQTIFASSPGGALFRLSAATKLGVLFDASGRNGCGIKNLWLEGPGTLTTAPGISQTYTQCGFLARSTPTNCFVDECVFSNWEGGGIFMEHARKCRVVHNTFTTALCQPLAQSNFGSSDITLWGSSVDCRVESNTSDSGASYHVILQTVLGAAQAAYRNKIRGNTTTGNKIYGILVYNIDSSIHAIESTEIVGNTIRDVYGFYRNPASPSYPSSGAEDYGAGIYVLQAEKTIIGYNLVENVCINSLGSTLTPAGIAINATSDASIVGNKVSTSAWYGIFVVDTLQQGAGTSAGSVNFVPTGHVVIEGNAVRDTVKHGIYVKDKHRVSVRGNTVNNVTGASMSAIVTEVSTANYPLLKGIAITSNSARAFTTAGILSGLTQGADISGNQIDGSGGGTTGIFAEATDGTINGNNIRAITGGSGRGVDLRSTGANNMMSGNTVTGCTVGILAAHRISWGENDVRSNTTDWSGAYAYRVAAAPTTTFAARLNDRVLRTAMVVGQPKGWSVTVAPATVTGSITTGTNTLTLSAASTFANGQGITVAGAGAAGAALNTTITSGGGTVNLVLVANASTTVTGATTTHAGTWVSEGNL